MTDVQNPYTGIEGKVWEALHKTVVQMSTKHRSAKSAKRRRLLPGGCPECRKSCYVTLHQNEWLTECCGREIWRAGTAEFEFPGDQMGR